MLISIVFKGFSFDWVNYNIDKGFYYDEYVLLIGSYNVICVYFWVSMMVKDVKYKIVFM